MLYNKKGAFGVKQDTENEQRNTLLNKKFSNECVGPCEEMGLQPISELFMTDGG